MPARICRPLTADEQRGISLGRAIDAALREVSGTAALIRLAVVEGRADRAALGWADRLESAREKLEEAVRRA